MDHQGKQPENRPTTPLPHMGVATEEVDPPRDGAQKRGPSNTSLAPSDLFAHHDLDFPCLPGEFSSCPCASIDHFTPLRVDLRGCRQREVTYDFNDGSESSSWTMTVLELKEEDGPPLSPFTFDTGTAESQTCETRELALQAVDPGQEDRCPYCLRKMSILDVDGATSAADASPMDAPTEGDPATPSPSAHPPSTAELED